MIICCYEIILFKILGGGKINNEGIINEKLFHDK